MIFLEITTEFCLVHAKFIEGLFFLQGFFSLDVKYLCSSFISSLWPAIENAIWYNKDRSRLRPRFEIQVPLLLLPELPSMRL
jgi:hypothetical protein